MVEFAHVDAPRGRVYVHGGHVSRWAPAGDDVLFVSDRARLEPGAPIRGGIPVVFPWFGDDPEGRGRPAHGFARRVPWRLLEHDGDRVALELVDNAATHRLWPHRFALRLQVTFGDALELLLTVENRGDAAWSFEAALHTYLRVGDVRECAVRGLRGARYLDKTSGMRAAVQADELLRFDRETDRIYPGATATCSVADPVLGRAIEVRKHGASSTIVWNPWADKARALADLGDDEWRRMLCVESGNVGDDAVTLPAGASHAMRVTIAVR